MIHLAEKVAFLLFAALLAALPAAAQDGSARYAGEARLGAYPPQPIHIELHRAAGSVTGTITLPEASFELVGATGQETIVGRFQGDGGSGAVELRIDGDRLSGGFDLGGQGGTITADLTTMDAATFFTPPEQRLDLATAEWLEDLDRLADILMTEHASPFHRVPRARLEDEIARLRDRIPTLDGIAIALEFQRLAAMIGDGHTSVALPQDRPRLPVEFFWFEDGLRIVGASAEHRGLLGAALVAVNDRPAEEVVERLRAFVPQGETEWFDRARIPPLLADPDALDAAGIGAGAPISLTLDALDGDRVQVRLAAGAGPVEMVPLGGSPPLWQRDATEAFRSTRLGDGSVHVNWRSYDGLAGNAAALLRDLDETHPARLVVDLRANDGGDLVAGRDFIDEIRARPWLNRRGVLYVLIGRTTFSAAMSNAVDFATTTEAILVGEPAGAAPNNWQEVRRTRLPNSGLEVGVSTRFVEFLPGEALVDPDIRVPPTIGDWTDGPDAAVRAVLARAVP